MISRLKTIATAAALSVAAVSPSFAMEDEVNMLTGSIFNMLSIRNMDTAAMANLTLHEINQISSIVHSGDTESEQDAKIGAILRRAAER